MGFVEKHKVELTKDLKAVKMIISGVPATITSYGHGIGAIPSYVMVTHTAYGTTGVVQHIVGSANITAISLRASLSGVGVDVMVLP